MPGPAARVLQWCGCQWAPLSLPWDPTAGAWAVPGQAWWPGIRARCHHLGGLGPFPLPCPKIGPFPSSWVPGAVAGPCLPVGLHGRADRIQCQEVILARGSGGQRNTQVLRGTSWGWHPSGPLPVPLPQLP